MFHKNFEARLLIKRTARKDKEWKSVARKRLGQGY